MQGQYYDPEIDLCYNRYRYFDPHTCSFISQDPLGLAAGENVYAYAPNVWGWIDPLGLCKEASKGTPSIKWGAQEKHFPGHNSYTPGRSTMTADPTKLAEKAGKGQKVGNIQVGQPGSKERVNFGEKIGTYIDQAGNSSPTTNGLIHYSKDGIHIVPARP
jgi:RHS repeat-associated protein